MIDNVKIITDYLLSLGFEIQPCLVPLNGWEDLKMDTYVALRRKKFEKIFQFLSKRFPIKSILERPDKSIWFGIKSPVFQYWQDGKDVFEMKTVVEIELKPTTKTDDYGGNSFNYDIYFLNVRVDFGRWTDIVGQNNAQMILHFNKGDYMEGIEFVLSKIDLLKPVIRQNKLDKLIPNG